MLSLRVILVVGPTASGKSDLALSLARRMRGIVINADAIQLYEGLPILTAQPSDLERSEIPHRLYGSFDPAAPSSVAKWLAEALRAIRDAHQSRFTPILVGGTGLYFRALTEGLSDVPDVPSALRAQAQALYDTLGEARFREALSSLDPESASRLARNDRQRLIRAYEVALHTGKPIGYWQSRHRPTDGALFTFERHLLMPQREQLYASCDARFLRMMEQGALEEARLFLARGLDPSLPAMKTIGLRELAAHLRGACTMEDAVARAQQATRNYAKRQITWFRNQWPSAEG